MLEIVKRVLLNITPLGEIESTEKFNDPCAPFYFVVGGELEKQHVASPLNFTSLIIEKYIPKGFTVTVHASPSLFEVSILNVELGYEFEFSLRLHNKGIAGYVPNTNYRRSHFGTFDEQFKENQVFYYPEGQAFNSLTFFRKIHALAKPFFESRMITNTFGPRLGYHVSSIYPRKDYYQYAGKDEYVVIFDGPQPSIVVSIKDNVCNLIGDKHDDEDAGRHWVETIESKKAKIEELRNEIAFLEEVKVNLKRDPLMSEKMPKDTDPKPKSDAQLKKEEANRLRALPRNEVLMKWPMKKLLEDLRAYQRGNFNDYDTYLQFPEEQIRAELAHRPHVKSKKERSESQKAHHGKDKSKNK